MFLGGFGSYARVCSPAWWILLTVQATQVVLHFWFAGRTPAAPVRHMPAHGGMRMAGPVAHGASLSGGMVAVWLHAGERALWRLLSALAGPLLRAFALLGPDSPPFLPESTARHRSTLTCPGFLASPRAAAVPLCPTEEHHVLFAATKTALTCAGAVTALIVAPALPASAHVTVNPNTAEPGGYGAFDVRVPNEATGADTTEVRLYLPTDHPIASVSVRPTPGWTVEVTKGTLPKPIKTDDGEITKAVTEITWSGGKIVPGQFQQFGISLGPLPDDTAKLYFKALQTYTGKSGKESVVRWTELPGAGAEPEHPAPSLTLVKAAAPKAAPAAKADDTTGVLGLVAGLFALVVAVAAFVRAGRSGA